MKRNIRGIEKKKRKKEKSTSYSQGMKGEEEDWYRKLEIEERED